MVWRVVALAVTDEVKRLRPLAEAPDMIPARDVPRFIAMSKNTVYAAIDAGHMPHVRFGKLLFVPKAALEALAAEAIQRASAARQAAGA